MEIQLDCLTQKDLAALFGKTERTVMRWHQFGLPQHGKGQGCYYIWTEVLPWYVAYEAGLRAGDPTAKLPRAPSSPRPGPNCFRALELLEKAQDALRGEIGVTLKQRCPRRKKTTKLAPRKSMSSGLS